MKKKKPLKVHIRPALKSDLDACYVLGHARELAPPNRTRAERIWIRDMLRAKQILLVAEIDEEVVGFIMGETATSQVALLHLMSVQPKWRGKGIGTKLLQAFEREARRRHISCILAYSFSERRTRSSLLHRQGYAAGSLVREYQKFL